MAAVGAEHQQPQHSHLGCQFIVFTSKFFVSLSECGGGYRVEDRVEDRANTANVG